MSEPSVTNTELECRTWKHCLIWGTELEIIFIPVVLKRRTRYSDWLSTRLELNSLCIPV